MASRVCIDVDGSCTDGDDDWGYVDHGDGDGDNICFRHAERLDDDGDGLLSWTEESYIVNHLAAGQMMLKDLTSMKYSTLLTWTMMDL